MLDILLKVAFILLIFLLVINVFSFVLLGTSDKPVTFTNMLDKLSGVKLIDMDINSAVQIFSITDDWGAFNWARDIINALGSVIGFAVWICTLFINLVYFIGYVLYLLGVQSVSVYV